MPGEYNFEFLLSDGENSCVVQAYMTFNNSFWAKLLSLIISKGQDKDTTDRGPSLSQSMIKNISQLKSRRGNLDLANRKRYFVTI